MTLQLALPCAVLRLHCSSAPLSHALLNNCCMARHDFPQWRPQDLSRIFPMLEESGLDLLKRTLEYDPAKRLSVSALHPPAQHACTCGACVQGTHAGFAAFTNMVLAGYGDQHHKHMHICSWAQA